MKTLWMLLAGSALALATAYPGQAGAQQISSPTPAVTNTPLALSPAAAVQAPAGAPTQAKAAEARPATLALSPWTAEIAKLARAGIEDDVLLTYIDGTEGTFNLTADQIIYLKTLGVSSQAISLMMQHDGEVNAGIRTVAASTVPPSQPTLHIVFTSSPKAAKAEAKPANETMATPEPPDGTAVADSELAEATTENPAAWNVDFGNLEGAPETAPPEPAGLSESYPVRQPYAEEVMGPILVFKANARIPNVIVIDFSP